MKELKTFCCGATYTRQGRLDYRCDECGKDVTYDIVITYIALESPDETRNKE